MEKEELVAGVKKYVTYAKARQLVRRAKEKGKKVAFTSGCFDVLHVGHVLFLEDCRSGVDLLVVGIDDNQTVTRAKGKDHPFFDETERIKVLATLEIVDYIFKFRGPCSADLIKGLSPNFYCFSPYDPKYKEKTADAKKAGAKVKEAGFLLKSWSSSKIGRLLRYSFMLESWMINVLDR